MSKADDVRLIVRYALEGDDEKVRAAVKLLAAHEREAGRSPRSPERSTGATSPRSRSSRAPSAVATSWIAEGRAARSRWFARDYPCSRTRPSRAALRRVVSPAFGSGRRPRAAGEGRAAAPLPGTPSSAFPSAAHLRAAYFAAIGPIAARGGYRQARPRRAAPIS